MTRDDIGSFTFSDHGKRTTWQNNLTALEKIRYHRNIADMLINDLPETENKAIMVASHLLCISNDIEGCEWLMKAADSHHREFRVEDALHCYIKLIDDLSGLSDQQTDMLFCDAAIKYSKLSTAKYDTKRVLAILDEAMSRAKSQMDYRYQSLLEMHIAKNKWLQSQYSSALRHFENAWVDRTKTGR